VARQRVDALDAGIVVGILTNDGAVDGKGIAGESGATDLSLARCIAQRARRPA
jgi:hypothetical protein